MKLNPWWIVIAAAMVLLGNMGIRQSMGLMLPDINLDLSIPVSELAFGFGVQNLIWGAVAPFAGVLAERYGTVKVLLFGTVTYAVGLLIAAMADSGLVFFIGNALVIGLGAGATAYPVALAVVGRRFPAHKRSFALGIASAGGSLGQFAYAYAHSHMAASHDWVNIFYYFAASCVLMAVFALLLKEKEKEQERSSDSDQKNVQSPLDFSVITSAFKARDYKLLNIGFFVCGFHVAMVTVHLSGLVNYCGLPAKVASDSIALIGLFNVLGVVCAGWLGDYLHKPWLLSTIYFLRSLLLLALIMVPPTSTLFYIFAVLMGVLWLSTVPVTSGTVADMFGTANLASLFGMVMLSHQIGAFFGSWLGGVTVDASGSYDLILAMGVVLGILAAAVHLPITRSRLQLQSA